MLGKIAAIGIEVEGLFSTYNDTPYPHISGLVEEYLWPQRYPEGDYYQREAVSIPLSNKKRINGFFDELKQIYYEDYYSQGMGLHIHFSFHNSKYYSALFNKEFATAFYKFVTDNYMDEYFRERMSWRSPEYETDFYKTEYPDHYFKHSHPDSGRQNKYYMINFTGAYQGKKTFELRLFPAKECSVMKDYVYGSIAFINKYISNLEKDGVSCKTSVCKSLTTDDSVLDPKITTSQITGNPGAFIQTMGNAAENVVPRFIPNATLGLDCDVSKEYKFNANGKLVERGTVRTAFIYTYSRLDNGFFLQNY